MTFATADEKDVYPLTRRSDTTRDDSNLVSISLCLFDSDNSRSTACTLSHTEQEKRRLMSRRALTRVAHNKKAESMTI